MTRERKARTIQKGPAPPAARDIALEALLCGQSKDSAAKEAGIHPRTLSKWLEEDHEFRQEYEERRGSILEGVEETIRIGKRIGVETLIKLAQQRDREAAITLAKMAEPIRIAGHDGGPLNPPQSREEALVRAKAVLAALEGDGGDS